MASFAETIERQRASVTEKASAPVQGEPRLRGEQAARDAFERRQLMGLLDEAVDFARSEDGHPDAKWYFFMEQHAVTDIEVDLRSSATHFIYLPYERPVAQLQWSERKLGRVTEVGFRLTLEQPNYDRLIVGADIDRGVYVPVGDDHVYDVVAAQYDRAAVLPHFPYPAALAS